MPSDNERRINEAQNNPTLPYATVSSTRVRPLDLDADGNLKTVDRNSTNIYGRLHDIILAAGTAVIGWVKAKHDIVTTEFTGAGDIVVATHQIAPAAAYKLVAVDLHLSAAPTTGAQTLVITKDAGAGAAYDKVLLSIDLVANAVTDLTIKPEDEYMESDDVVTVAWTNTNTRTYGLTFKHELV